MRKKVLLAAAPSLVVFSALLPMCFAIAQKAGPDNAPLHDGAHDFDFEPGAWKVHVERLAYGSSGSPRWDQWDGVSHCRKVWAGKANLVELEADGPAGHLEFLSLRLYNPGSQQWSLYYARSERGQLATASIGEFRNGRGEFYDQETYQGRMVLMRGVLTHSSERSVRFEQAFSVDGGKTWELNFTEQFTRLSDDGMAAKH